MNLPCPPLRVAMFAPERTRCGIADYSRHLATALRALPDIAGLRTVAAPADRPPGSLQALRRFAEGQRRFRALGEQMNVDADMAHIQHQYFLFGGVAPHKNHARALLDALRLPVVMTVHEIASSGSETPLFQSAALASTNRANFQHPAIRRLIVHTQADASRLAAMGTPSEWIHVLPVGVPPVRPMPAPEEARCRLELEGRRVLTLFGFLAVKKGHRLALEAMRWLPQDVVLLFAGEQHPDDRTDYVANLRAEIAAQRLADRVRITGYLPEERIPLVMAATDVALAPFSASSGSASVAHCLAYGRPLVASDIAPHRELQAMSPDCLALFPAGDAHALAEQVRSLLDDADRRAQLRAAALRYADRCSFANVAQETVRIYCLAQCGR